MKVLLYISQKNEALPEYVNQSEKAALKWATSSIWTLKLLEPLDILFVLPFFSSTRHHTWWPDDKCEHDVKATRWRVFCDKGLASEMPQSVRLPVSSCQHVLTNAEDFSCVVGWYFRFGQRNSRDKDETRGKNKKIKCFNWIKIFSLYFRFLDQLT